MAKKTNDKYLKKLARFKRRRKLRMALSLILLAISVAVGGTVVAFVAHLHRMGMLDVLEVMFEEFLYTRELDVSFIVFWLLPIPIVLAFILIISVARMRKFKEFRMTWEQTAKYAIEAERRSFEAKREELLHSKRFSGLNDIVSPRVPETGEVQSFKQLCETFRMYAAKEHQLYYTETQIRVFIASLAVSKLIILQGMSGTGKTSLAYAYGQFLGNPSTVVPVQPSWKERSDMLGYFNEFTKKYNETPLLKKIYEANGSNQIYITVLDEMNVARMEYYFAEFLSLLEIPDPELRYLEVVADVWDSDPPGLKDGRIKLPENMWFLGTANNDDSTFAISDKVYDRAMIIDLKTRAQPFAVDAQVKPPHMTYDEFVRLSQNAQRGYELTRRNERRLAELGEYLADKFQIAYGNRILRQIHSYVSVYVACGGDELEALDDIICKKVLRKLVYKDTSQIQKALKEASKYLEKLFGEGKMQICREYLARLTK